MGIIPTKVLAPLLKYVAAVPLSLPPAGKMCGIILFTCVIHGAMIKLTFCMVPVQ